ncbi:MAG TPA: DUF2242 domain-containing protein [Luteimonas sp.]|nr:DUF2242 domain-containing protein [Luteimonas sp.]
MPRARATSLLLPVFAAALLAGCASRQKQDAPPSGETFDADDTYSRSLQSTPAQACEAARRALLGQGYVVGRASADAVEATKNFQPQAETHTQIEVRVTCLPQDGTHALVFVNAVQDRYALKKTSSSASVGVGVLGSVSLPVGSSDDSLVRVASNTVQNTKFYQRFFERVKYYLPSEPDRPAAPPPEPAAPPDPEPQATVPADPAADAPPPVQ